MALPAKERDINVGDYLRILVRRRWVILSVAVLLTAAGGFYTFRQTPIYQAAAVIQMDPEPPRVIGIQEVVPSGPNTPDYYQTQHALIKSRAVLDKVIETTQLKQRMPELGRLEDPTAAIRGAVGVESRRGTRLVEIRYESPDPALAAEMANAVARAYVASNLDRKLKGAKEAIAWLSDQMGDLQKRHQDSLMNLQNYRIKAGILGLNEQRQITTGKIMAFNSAYLESQAARLTIEAKLRQLTAISQDPGGAQSIFTVADSPLIQKLKTEASDLEVQLARLKQTYREKHPEVVKVQAQLEEVRRKIDTALQTMLRAVQTELSVARAREEALLRNLNELKKEGTALNETEIKYQTMQRESDSTQKMLDLVLSRLKETGLTSGLEANNVRVIEEAVVPKAPVRPNKRANIALSVALGLFLGTLLGFVLEYQDNTIKTPDDVKRYLDLPILAVVPVFGAKP